MAKPCNQKQLWELAKKFPWTIERSLALFKEARTNYTEKGITDFNKIVDGLSANHNLKREIIIEGLASPRGVSRKLTNDMWVRQSQARQVANTAKAAVRELDKSKFVAGLNFAINAPRRVILAGHFGAFTKSHLSDQAFYNPKVYAQNFTRSWHLATKAGRALHEQELMMEFNPTDPDVKLALRSGLNVGEGGYGKFAKEAAEVTGIKKFFKGPDRATMAYDRLRISRMKIFRKELDRLSDTEKADIDQVKELSSAINHDTGTVGRNWRGMKFMFLSPRLFPAQVKHTFIDIPKALVQTGMGVNYAKASPAMRYVARKAAILASAYTAGLAANYGIGKAVGALGGDEEAFTPNLGQEGWQGIKRTSFLRPKLFGHTIPVSPTVELLKLPIQMIAAGATAPKGENKIMAALERGLRTAVGRQNPIWDTVQEALFGQDVGTGRPTPFPGITGRTEETRTKKKIGWVEYAGTKMPIPVANYVQEFYDEATSHGMPPKDALEWVKLIVVPSLEVAGSYHIGEEHKYEPPPVSRSRGNKRSKRGERGSSR